MRLIKRGFLGVAIFMVVIVVVFAAWANTPLAAMPQAIDALQPDSLVTVSQEKWLAFQPQAAQPDSGLIIYPGGRVDPRSYAPLARAVAQQGYLVVVVPMPFNLAVFGSGRAQEVMAAYPQVKHWAVGGHSLGGAMAARFAFQHPGVVSGLVLWAAYPASSDDLSESQLAVVSIIGSRDGLGTGDGVQASRQLLPPDTGYVIIDGGNHAQFGWYGDQPGDVSAEISREAQQDQALRATLELLEKLRNQQ